MTRLASDENSIWEPPRIMQAVDENDRRVNVHADQYQNDGTGENEPATGVSFQTISDLMRECPSLRDPVIEGLLRRGESMNIIAPPKFSKSWAAMDLAIHVALGRCWLNKFPTIQGDVLIIDNELHRQTLANRIPKVAHARGIMPSSLDGKLFVESLRGKLKDIFAMRHYFDSIEPGRFAMIVCDAFYRFLPRSADENSNADLAQVYNQIDRYAERLGCAFVLIHHSSKGVQSSKSVTDVGAGASAQARAVDPHFIFRAHETDGAVVVEAAVRSWPPLAPFCMKWEYPVWVVADDLDPTQLKQERSRRARKEESEPTEPAIVWNPQKFAEMFITAQPVDKRTITARATVAELSGRRAEDFIRVALADRIIYRWAFPKDKTVYLANMPQPVVAEKGAA